MQLSAARAITEAKDGIGSKGMTDEVGATIIPGSGRFLIIDGFEPRSLDSQPPNPLTASRLVATQATQNPPPPNNLSQI